MPESKCVKHKAHRLSPFCQAISCGCQNSLAAAASPSSPPSPSCLSSRQQRGGQNSSSRSCTTPCSCEKASLCPPCLNSQQRRRTDHVLLHAAVERLVSAVISREDSYRSCTSLCSHSTHLSPPPLVSAFSKLWQITLALRWSSFRPCTLCFPAQLPPL